MERDAAYIARLESVDNGKPYTDATAEVGMSVDTIRYYAGYCDKIHGNTVPCGETERCVCLQVAKTNVHVSLFCISALTKCYINPLTPVVTLFSRRNNIVLVVL